MSTPEKTCFVVMGFGEKVDFETGRKLNLNASYFGLIKPAVEAAGLKCVRADEIAHSGVIDVPMYKQILLADLVIADVSTANCNAFYELGVRHALRPHTTIIISEDKFKFPFDIGHIVVRTYRHLGEDIGVTEAKRFTADLEKAIKEILGNEPPQDDSPVYTFLHGLRRLNLPDDYNEKGAPPVAAAAAKDAPDETHAELMEQVAEAKKAGDFVTARALLSTVRKRMKGKSPDKPEDPYIIQQLALVTYKGKLPTPQKALEEARDLLLTLDPETSNDTETLGMWGAVHKRLWDLTKDPAHLDEAVRGYERGFYLRNDYYNGINLAFILNVRAANAAGRAEAVADFVQAERIRREVVEICKSAMKDGGMSADSKYWVLATMAEAYLGVGDEANADKTFQEAAAVASADWMKESTTEQMDKLRALLADSPLKFVKAEGE
jgi:hypothetical protein